MNMLLIILNCMGLFAVGLCFMFWMPVWANLLIGMFSSIFGEMFQAKRRGEDSGTKLINPNEIEELQS